jgi:hypothetical protein
MAAFDYRQALEIRDALARHGVRYLFIGKAGAILLGFPDTTQDADLFVDRSPANGRALVAALRELGFDLNDDQAAEIEVRLRADASGSTRGSPAPVSAATPRGT